MDHFHLSKLSRRHLGAEALRIHFYTPMPLWSSLQRASKPPRSKRPASQFRLGNHEDLVEQGKMFGVLVVMGNQDGQLAGWLPIQENFTKRLKGFVLPSATCCSVLLQKR